MFKRLTAVGAVIGVMALAVGVVASVARAGGFELTAEFEAEDGGLVVVDGTDDSATTTSVAPDSSSTTSASPTTSSTAGSPSTTSTSLGDSTTTSTSIPGDDDDELAAPMSLTFLAGAAGSVDVLLVGDEIVFAGASALAGWEFEVDHAGGSHVDVDFHHEDGVTLEFRVDVDLRVRIEIDAD